MPVGVGVVAGGDLIALPVGDQRGHRVGGTAIHPDLAVGVQGHEPPGRVDQGVDHRQFQVVPLGDRAPVVDAGPTQRIGADADSLGADGMDVDDTRQIGDIGVQVIVSAGVLKRPGQRHPLHLPETAAQNLVGPLGDRRGGIGVGRPPIGRVVLEAAVAGRVVRGGNDDPVRQSLGTVAVVAEDGVADRRGRGIAIRRINQHHNIIGGQHLQRRDPGRLRQPMGVAAQEQRPGGALRGTVLGDGLSGGQDMGLVERRIQTGPTVPGGSERHLLVDVLGVGLHGVVRRHQVGQVDQIFGLRRLSGAGVGRHARNSAAETRY